MNQTRANALKWTTDTPTVPGRYWVKGVQTTIQYAEVRSDGTVMLMGWEYSLPLSNRYFSDAQWCGPLEVPK